MDDENKEKTNRTITKIKYALLVFSLCFICFILFIVPCQCQSGGGLEKLNSLVTQINTSDIIATGKSVMFKFLSGCIFVIGIVIILSILPIIPIAILLFISYFFYRDKIYFLKTM